MGGNIHHAPAKPATKNNCVIFTGFHVLDPGNDLIDIDWCRLPFGTRGIRNSGIKAEKHMRAFSGSAVSCFIVSSSTSTAKTLYACHFTASPVYRIEAVDYPATRPADSNGNYPHTMILCSPVMFPIMVL